MNAAKSYSEMKSGHVEFISKFKHTLLLPIAKYFFPLQNAEILPVNKMNVYLRNLNQKYKCPKDFLKFFVAFVILNYFRLVSNQ